MRKVIYFCDKCNRQLPGYAFRLFAGEFDATEQSTTEKQPELIGELCPACYKVALATVQASFAEGHPDKPEPKKKTRGGAHNRKQLDLGKIAALRNAGWSFDKIGEEVGCSAQTVANRMEEAQAFLRRQNLATDLEEALNNDIQEVTQ